MPHRNRHRRPLFFLAFVFLVAPGLRSEESLHRVWAVKDARIITLAGAPVEKGNLVIRNGLVEAVGPAVPIPADAEVIDGAKLTIYPGLMDGLGQSLLKLPEEKMDMTRISSGEFTDKDRGITPGLAAFDTVSLGKAVFEKYHKLGFTAGHVMPDRGVFTGRSALFCFSDPDKNKALLLKDVCLGIGFSPSSFMAYPNSLMGVNAYLKQALTDALYFDRALSSWLKEMKGVSRPEYSPNLETIAGYAAAAKPVIFLCRNQHDIRRSLSLAAEYKLDFFIADLGGEAFEVIPELKKANARLLCTVAFKAPGSSLYAQQGKAERERAEKEIYPKNPAHLAEAGLPFAFSSLGTDDPKAFAEGIQKAIEAGLPKDRALEALTKTPAAFFGLDRALGTIEPGKIANVVLVEGELLAKEPKVRDVFTDGRRFELKEVKPGEGEKPTVNLTGKWEMTIEWGTGMKLTVDFAQDEAALSGRMTTPFGVFEFTGGAVSGNSFSLEMNVSVGGEDLDLFFSGTVEGERMTGSVVQGGAGTAEFTGRRIPG
jgi:imidazolonepropionase-like amidohydrolase